MEKAGMRGVRQALLFVFAGLPAICATLLLLLPAFGYSPGLAPYAGPGVPLVHILTAEPGLIGALLDNLFIGLAVTALSTMLAFLLLAAGNGERRRRRTGAMLPLLLALPHAAAAFSTILLIAPSGWLLRIVHAATGLYPDPPQWSLLHDRAGILVVLVLTFKEVPFLYFLGLAALSGMPVRRSRMVMAVTGYGRIAGFLASIGPALYLRLRLPVLIVLCYAISVADIPLLVGPDMPPPLSVRILEWLADPDLSRRYDAAAAALLLVLATLAGLGVWWLGERALARLGRTVLVSGHRFSNDLPLRLLLGLTALSGVLLAGGGYAVLGLWSLARRWTYPDLLPAALTGENWADALDGLLRPMLATLLLGMAAASLALILSVLLLWRPGRSRPPAGEDRLVLLPLLLPQVAIVSGLQLALLQAGIAPGSMVLLAAHLVFVFPYVHLMLKGPWRDLDRRYEQLAESMGKPPLAVLLQLRLPLLLAPLLTAWAVGFAVSAGLYLPTQILGAGRITTLVTEAVALGSGGDRRQIGTYALLQAATVLAVFAGALALPALRWRHRRGMRER